MLGDFFKNYLLDLTTVLNKIDEKEYEALIANLTTALENKALIFICGNGGSASTASHFAGDINKGASYGKEKRFKVICLNDNIPTIMAYANDVSYNDIFVEQLKNFMNKNDLLIGISGSGNSENILRAIRYCNENGGVSFGISGLGGGKLREIAGKSLVIQSNDMQKVEDAHLVIVHSIMQWFNRSQSTPLVSGYRGTG